jgi:hypothetical protein
MKSTKNYISIKNKWVLIKKMYEDKNSDKEKLNELTKEFTEMLGDITIRNGDNCIVNKIPMDLWKERIWNLIENAGLLPAIAWREENN